MELFIGLRGKAKQEKIELNTKTLIFTKGKVSHFRILHLIPTIKKMREYIELSFLTSHRSRFRIYKGCFQS